MTKRKNRPSNTPLASFGSELLAVLIRGSEKRTELKDVPYSKAVKLRHRLHTLRARMRDVQHPQCELVMKARLSVHLPEGCEVSKNDAGERIPKDKQVLVTLRIDPRDSEFADLIRDAGVDLRLGDDFLSSLPFEDRISRPSDARPDPEPEPAKPKPEPKKADPPSSLISDLLRDI